MPQNRSSNGCLIKTWHRHSGRLRGWLLKHVESSAETDDLLQEIFYIALMQRRDFCSIKNARAWLFRVARNMLIDRHRLHKINIPLPDTLQQEKKESIPVDGLSQCLPRILSELSSDDREAIRLCDLEGMSQRQYAELKGVSLAAAKSRVQRARKRLKKQLETVCQVSWDETDKVCCFVPRPPLK